MKIRTVTAYVLIVLVLSALVITTGVVVRVVTGDDSAGPTRLYPPRSVTVCHTCDPRRAVRPSHEEPRRP